MTLSHFQQAPAGLTYQAWALRDGSCVSVGTGDPGPDGRALLIAESPVLAGLPEGVRVTLEPVVIE